jgi:uncharacterized protein
MTTAPQFPEFSMIDPRMRWVWFAQYSFWLSIPAIGISIALVVFDFWWLSPFVFVLIYLGSYFYVMKAYARYGYAIAEAGLWLRHGVIWQAIRFVPRARVQHTDVVHGPIDRKLELAQLVVNTAGLQYQNVSIPGLTEARAHELRDLLLLQTG